MYTKLPLVTKPEKSSRFRLWITALFFIALCSTAPAVWAQTGLHYTPAEVAVWRQRASATATSGTQNYRIAGDVQANSPDDWKRIKDYAKDFNDFTTTHRYIITVSGCIPRYDASKEPQVMVVNKTINGSYYYTIARGDGLMDAAFVDLVQNSTTYFAKVKQELLWHANPDSAAHLNFANPNLWCRSSSSILYDSNPGFAITEWMMKMLFAYDCYKDKFSAGEKVILNKWFADAANYFQYDLDLYYSNIFANRFAGNYTLLGSTIYGENDTLVQNPKYPLYYNSDGTPGTKVGLLGRKYNNRMGTIARFIGTAGIFLNDNNLKVSAKRFFREWLKYGVYPTMDLADMSRSQQQLAEGNPAQPPRLASEKGFDYSIGFAFTMAHLADVFARAGEDSLYTYSTTEGYFGSQVIGAGTPKTLVGVIQNLQKYMTGTHPRYGLHSVGNWTITDGDVKHLINGVTPDEFADYRGEITWDTWFAQANKYYRNASIKLNYLRSATITGIRPYPVRVFNPVSPKLIGNNQPWSGAGAVLPGVLFMYGQMENTTASPYSKLPVITWSNPAPILYGMPLSSTQLNASASVTGTFTYSPAAGYILNAGPNQKLVVNFMPADTFNFKATSDTVLITVSKATPVITWGNPVDITYGTPLSATQLNATASVTGTFVYTPAAGVVLNAGANQNLSVTFTPTDQANYNTPAAKTVSINVLKATPVITWGNPVDITYGTALSGTQLNATATATYNGATITVPGTLNYTPAAGNVPNAGINRPLSVNFIPSTTANYNTPAAKTVLITVTGSILREYWAIANGAGNSVSAIPVTTTPTSTSQMTSFQGPLPAAGTYGIGDNYGTRYRGYLCVPSTGNYTFWISSDNDGELWLSTDSLPTNKAKIANLTGVYTWNNWTQYASQQSSAKYLVAGKKYYIEALQKEGSGGDQLLVGWRLPTSAVNATPVIIPGSVLAPYTTPAARMSAENLTESTIPRMNVFPNPSTGKVFVHFTTTATEYASVNMYNMWGGLVHPLFAGKVEAGEENQIEMDGRQFGTGMYVIRLVTPNKVDFKKIILMK